MNGGAVDYRQLAMERYAYMEGRKDMRARCYSVACAAAAIGFLVGAIWF